MSEARYKEALGKLDPDMRTCIIYLGNQIKEIRVAPLKSFQELETKVLKAVSELESYKKTMHEAMVNLNALSFEYEINTPAFMEKNHDLYMRGMEDLAKKYLEAMHDCLKRYEKRFEKIIGDVEEVKKVTYEIYNDMIKIINKQKYEFERLP